jgi:archaemetzincin
LKTVLAIFLVISLSAGTCATDKNPVVGIQAFGNTPPAIADTVELAIQQFYRFKTIRMDIVEIPKAHFIKVKSPRYRADSIIRFLKRVQPDSIDFTIGLTHVDISTTKKDSRGNVLEPRSKYEDWGIFGLGYRPGPSCIVSTFRLKHPNTKTFYSRLKKISLHELGHNLGLPHCPDKSCFMQDAAETIKTIDAVEMNLCEKCRKKIR